MGRFVESAEVATGPEETFDYVTDQSKVAEWNDHVQSVDVVGGGTLEKGSQLRQHRRRGDRDFDLTFEVTEHQRPTRHTVRGSVFGLGTTMDFVFEAIDAGTIVTMSAVVTGKGFRALLSPVVTREMHKSTVAALHELRERLGTG